MKRSVITILLLSITSLMFATELKILWYGPSLYGFSMGKNDNSVFWGNIPEYGAKIQLEVQMPLFSIKRTYDNIIISGNTGLSLFWPESTNFRVDYFTIGSSIFFNYFDDSLSGLFLSVYPLYELSYGHEVFYWQSAIDLIGFSICFKSIPLNWGGYFRYVFQFDSKNLVTYYDFGLTLGFHYQPDCF